MRTINVQLLGKLDIRRDGAKVLGVEGRKVQELFCYILLHRDRSQPRESLASLLWDECSTAQSKTYLRKALWQLQTALGGEERTAKSSVLLTTVENVELNPAASLDLDVAALENAYASTRRVSVRMLDSAQAETIRSAVDLYCGDLLEGWYQDWVLYERERLQQIYLILLDKLMEYCEVHGDYEAGLTYGAQILRYERAHEHTYRRLMSLHLLAGDRTAALRQYERCAAVLQEEFGSQPDRQTIELYRQLQTNQLYGGLPGASSAPGKLESTPLLAQVLDRLTRFEVALTSLHQLVRQDIQIIERTLNIQGG